MSKKQKDKRFKYNPQQLVQPSRFDDKWVAFPTESDQQKSLEILERLERFNAGELLAEQKPSQDEIEWACHVNRQGFRVVMDVPTGLRHLDQIEKAIESAIAAGVKTKETFDDGSMTVTQLGRARQSAQGAREQFLRLMSRHPDLDEGALGWLCLEFFRLGNEMATHNTLTTYEQPIEKGFDAKRKEKLRGVGKGKAFEDNYRQPCRDMAAQIWGQAPLRPEKEVAEEIQKESGFPIGSGVVLKYIKDLNPRNDPDKIALSEQQCLNMAKQVWEKYSAHSLDDMVIHIRAELNPPIRDSNIRRVIASLNPKARGRKAI